MLDISKRVNLPQKPLSYRLSLIQSSEISLPLAFLITLEFNHQCARELISTISFDLVFFDYLCLIDSANITAQL